MKEDLREVIPSLMELLKKTERGKTVKKLILSDDHKYLVVDWTDCEPTIFPLEGRDGMDIIRYITASL